MDSLLLPGHDVPLGRYTTVRRLLPQRTRRTVGAWCFVDHFGPDDVAGRPGMRIGPHPHTGLQTVTWLVEGEILHRDSTGSRQVIVPGQLNVMTSGRGISHSEESPADHPPLLHGLQLWVALPESARHREPGFAHHATLPVVEVGDARVTVLAGAFAGAVSPAVVYSPLMGAEVILAGSADFPVERGFEYAAVVMTGAARVEGVDLKPGDLLYLGTGLSTVRVDGDARLFLFGGEPFDEPLVMWWNFVGRSHEEIAEARADWAAGRRFGTVSAEPPLEAPAMPTVRLKARTRDGNTR
ncbi:hypothetical protein Val02_13880 [Virgisporangium aliadipatigenens]|uniref:Pirin family protein n=1 Tax=Virgisporangium aliadipatigenens TaxID=741659 RepID=A0A8J4DPJ5_9ACTN|nr:pirin family protein [Virgisporangium aliadipatigenens]GIJ44502.1 hypothetical protein Val02_13880 [Virgisporangium aliadipatigenens]